MPSVVRVASETFVGRSDELRSALGVLRGLRTGHPGVIMVSGPAGIGKTRYVSTLADRLRADGVRVMIGACLDLGAGAPPYLPFAGVLRTVGYTPTPEHLKGNAWVRDARRLDQRRPASISWVLIGPKATNVGQGTCLDSGPFASAAAILGGGIAVVSQGTLTPLLRRKTLTGSGSEECPTCAPNQRRSPAAGDGHWSRDN